MELVRASTTTGRPFVVEGSHPEPMTLNGTTDIMPCGTTAPGLQVPKFVVPIKGSHIDGPLGMDAARERLGL